MPSRRVLPCLDLFVLSKADSFWGVSTSPPLGFINSRCSSPPLFLGPVSDERATLIFMLFPPPTKTCFLLLSDGGDLRPKMLSPPGTFLQCFPGLFFCFSGFFRRSASCGSLGCVTPHFSAVFIFTTFSFARTFSPHEEGYSRPFVLSCSCMSSCLPPEIRGPLYVCPSLSLDPFSFPR